MSLTRRGFLGMLTAAGAGSTPMARAADSPPSLQNSVPKRKFGRHDELVSVVGLGGMTLAQAPNIEEAKRIAHHAIDCGITFVENAWEYHGGRAEEWMGQVLEGGWRDKVFLMTKFCTLHNNTFADAGTDKAAALKMLDQQLQRLKTDHIDLWMIHMVQKMEEVDRIYAPNGLVEALDEAKKQGKIRYTGFTGHTVPEAHIKILEGGYPFDASLIPVSAVGALSSRDFEGKVLPEMTKRGVACLGMKGFGGSKRAHLHGLVNAEKVVRYSLSYPDVCTHVIGMDQYDFIGQAVAAAAKTPMTVDERKAFAEDCAAKGGAQFAVYLDPHHHDGCCTG